MAVTNLINTIWLFKENIDLSGFNAELGSSSGRKIEFQFESNSTSYTYIRIMNTSNGSTPPESVNKRLNYGVSGNNNPTVYSLNTYGTYTAGWVSTNNSTQVNSLYRIIKILSQPQSEADAEDLYNFLIENAYLVSELINSFITFNDIPTIPTTNQSSTYNLNFYCNDKNYDQITLQRLGTNMILFGSSGTTYLIYSQLESWRNQNYKTIYITGFGEETPFKLEQLYNYIKANTTFSTESFVTNLKVHKVPNFTLWKNQYDKVNGIGTTDIVTISPFELEKFFKENIYIVGTTSESDINPSNNEVHLESTYLDYIKQKNIFWLKPDGNWTIFLPQILNTTDPNFGREIVFISNDLLENIVINIKPFGDFSSGTGQFDRFLPTTEYFNYSLTYGKTYLKIKEVEYEENILGSNRTRGTWAILQESEQNEKAINIFTATYGETTYQQIKDAYDNEKLCIVKKSEYDSQADTTFNYIYYLSEISSSRAVFSRTFNGIIYTIGVIGNSWGESTPYDISEEIEKKLPFIVNITENNGIYTSNITLEEIIEAYELGRNIMAVYNNIYYPLTVCNTGIGMASFNLISGNSSMLFFCHRENNRDVWDSSTIQLSIIN